ncbi:putative HTH-type transcriptional regulator YdfH [Pseudovibrio sp. Ad14]|nr:putative HTH-type transcriptional regulator YdfH [Pseudovibrio sp. W74]KZL05321.1 putative HTH-type transcriptional regulator YdfH [Pseudovibrio sp. Ad14]
MGLIIGITYLMLTKSYTFCKYLIRIISEHLMNSAQEELSTPIKAGSAADPIYRDLKFKIMKGTLEGGRPLRQDEIASAHGVSKIPVREALRRLEIEGLVEFRPQRGAIVRKLSAEDVLQFIDIRLALECRALELAIPNMIERDLEHARSLLDDYAAETAIERWSDFNLQFHRLLYEPCGNKHLLGMISDLEQRIGPYMRLQVTEASGLDRPMREHHEILEACAREDSTFAVNTLRKHIQTTQKEVAAYLRRRTA